MPEATTTPNTNETPFQAGGELRPQDLPFSREIYRDSPTGRINLYGSTTFVPQVISSPKLTGKTTQLNFIAGNQERFSGRDELVRIDVILPTERRLSEAELIRELASKLRSRVSSTLRDLIESSESVFTGRGRKVLAIINADSLEEGALRWLLAGVRGLVEESEPLLRSQVQIVVDGSFSVETLTSGPDSEFPIPQIYPREFTANEQKQFVEARLSKIGISLDVKSFDALFAITAGDKYLTQSLCLYFARILEYPDEKVEIDENFLREARVRFVQENPRGDQLMESVVECVDELRGQGLRPEDVRDLLLNIGDRWNRTDPGLRAILYKGGVIRRSGEKSVELRAPLVMDIVAAAIARWKAALDVIETAFSLDGVALEQTDDAANLVWQSLGSTIRGSLTALHVGFGRRSGLRSIEVEATALDKGEYHGTVAMELSHDIPIGGNVWFILWGREVESGWRSTEIRIFRVRRPPDDPPRD